MSIELVRERFLARYRLMDLAEKSEIILEFEGYPYTWNPIYIEVLNNTATGVRMLEALSKQGKV